MSQPRHKHKRTLAEHDGERVRVTRSDGKEGDGTLRCEFDSKGQLGRVFIEGLKFSIAFARIGDWQFSRAAFRAAIDFRIPGYNNWWMISNLPVLLSKFTLGMGTKTREVMDNMGKPRG